MKEVIKFHPLTGDRYEPISRDPVAINQNFKPLTKAEKSDDSSSVINFLAPPLENLDTKRSSYQHDLTHSCQSSGSSIILDTTQDPIHQVDKNGRRISNESSCGSHYLQLNDTPLSHVDNSFTDTELLEKGLNSCLQHDLTDLSEEYRPTTRDEHLADAPTASYANVPSRPLEEDSGFTSVSGCSPSQMHKGVENCNENADSGFSGELKNTYPLP